MVDSTRRASFDHTHSFQFILHSGSSRICKSSWERPRLPRQAAGPAFESTQTRANENSCTLHVATTKPHWQRSSLWNSDFTGHTTVSILFVDRCWRGWAAVSTGMKCALPDSSTSGKFRIPISGSHIRWYVHHLIASSASTPTRRRGEYSRVSPSSAAHLPAHMLNLSRTTCGHMAQICGSWSRSAVC